MKLFEIYQPDRFGLSFELFPPKTTAGDAALMNHVENLMRFGPAFFTCTYGAGGSTREKTLEIVDRVKQRFQIPVASHLTCVGSTRDQLLEYLADARQRNIDYIVALRGDPPQGQTAFVATDGGLRYANELVGLIRNEFSDFGIAVAGYPEVHREAPSANVDLRNLKRKIDAGADLVISQLFYNNTDFLAFRDRCVGIGITIPIVPGILPVTSLGQVKRITSMCAAKLPDRLVERLSASDDPQWQMKVGIEHAAEQVRGLLASEIPGLHFYVLNKSQATSLVLKDVDLPD